MVNVEYFKTGPHRRTKPTFPRSKKKRIAKKWFKRTGYVRLRFISRTDSGGYLYEPVYFYSDGSVI
jgi:hypothetical protein